MLTTTGEFGKRPNSEKRDLKKFLFERTTTMKPSKYQQAIIDWAKSVLRSSAWIVIKYYYSVKSGRLK
jgi:hypothetical protein